MSFFKSGIIILLLAFFTWNAAAQSPKIYSISPSAAQAGATAFPIVVSGSNFKKSSVVKIGGVTLATLFVSWNKLRATVPASLAASAGSLEVKVFTKPNLSSNPVNLTIQGAPVGNYDWSALTARLQSFVPATVPGLTLQITRHGKIIYSQAFGNQTVNSVLPIASSTKMPSALAILTLVDEGRLDLDAPISTYLSNGYATIPADKATITTRMLLNHTSGLAQSDCLNDQATTTLKQCVQEILNSPLGFAPGTKFAYGGSSFQVAGGVVEAITGMSWNQFFAQKVANPLNLTRFTYTNTQNPRIAGGASSDVGDYNRIIQTYLSGGVYGDTRILSRAMYYEMQTDQKRDLPVVNSPGGTTLTGYSFGWWHSSAAYLQSQPSPQTPGLELSDQGAFGCTPWVDLNYNYTAVLLINDRTSTGTTIWNAIRPLIIAQMQANP
jgi:CubicO group peptidase (beta-lactamase class C family)